MTVGAARTVASVGHITLARLEQQALADQARTDRLVARRAALRQGHQQQQQQRDRHHDVDGQLRQTTPSSTGLSTPTDKQRRR